MNMNSTTITILSLAVSAGLLIGTFFFGGLWWTVKYGLRSKRPALLFCSSLLVRFALALAAFYAIGYGHVDRLIACLAGFVASRFLVGRILHSATNKKTNDALES
jgi:F1F0 ATPase subunit 2